jgi:hypothetical protein
MTRPELETEVKIVDADLRLRAIANFVLRQPERLEAIAQEAKDRGDTKLLMHILDLQQRMEQD